MRNLRRAIIGCRAVTLGAAALANSADQMPTATSCSQHYGYLMTDQWLTVDLTQQIERGLFYRHGAEAAELKADFEKLQQSVAAAGKELDSARSLYK